MIRFAVGYYDGGGAGPAPRDLNRSEAYPAGMDDLLLDHILDRQFLIAWAAERPRLGWWEDDVTDETGGGDFFGRWLSNVTDGADGGRWAAAEASRRVAIARDATARAGIVGGREQDDVLTLFHLGPEADRLVEDRLRWRRQQRIVPEMPVWENGAAFARFLRALPSAASWEPVPGGREVAPPRYRLDPNSRYKLRQEHIEQLVFAMTDGEARMPSTYPVPFIDQRRLG